MAEIARIILDIDGNVPLTWDRLAAEVDAWLLQARVARRDALVIVPLAQHLSFARHAFGRRKGWLPRIETLRTLAAGSLPPQRPEGAVSFDIAHDRLRARQMLRAHSWARQWSERDPRAFDETVARLVDCAHRLAQRASALAPADRTGWLARGRTLLAAGDEPGGMERLLARVAFEWVANSAPWPGDTLFALRPGAWVVVQAGGQNLMAQALLQAADASTPCLAVDTDPLLDDPLQAVPASSRLEYASCDDFEDEAEHTTAQLLALLAEGCHPLVLVAQDRVLVRRVGALLARQSVSVRDETGWKLSTTHAAAAVMALLRAASPGASTDDLLDWMKALPAGVPELPAAAVDVLERAVRRSGCTRRDGLASLPMEGLAAAAREWTLQHLAVPGGRATLSQWMRWLRERLHAGGQWAVLKDDAAGAQVLAALRLERADAAWNALAESLPLDWLEFLQAVDEMLEQAVFEPPALPDAAVVITPMRRALLRPFAAAVLPAADERHLGATAAADPLLGEALSVALGLPSVAQQMKDEAIAFAQLLHMPRILMSSRRHDDGEAIERSLLVERLMLQRERAGMPVSQPADARLEALLVPQPQPRPAPSASKHLPTSLSASTVEALRDCPYRFFSRSVLRLREPEELDDQAEKRDYGNWLHAVLLRFHQERPHARSVPEDLAALYALARLERDAAGWDDASFLPFEASFERFAPYYAEWVQQRDAEGVQWLEGETDRYVVPPELEGIALQGRLDRLDLVDGRTRQLIDYKTVSFDALRKRVRDPLEDTQLAFYAALELLRDRSDALDALQAAYLALDESDGIKVVPHPEVQASARTLLQSLAEEFARLRAGAALPALGAGPVCDRCEARGLCRRDHWADETLPYRSAGGDGPHLTGPVLETETEPDR